MCVLREQVTTYQSLSPKLHVRNPITDYRTAQTGIYPRDLLSGICCPSYFLYHVHCNTAPPFEDIQLQVAGLIQGKVLVGHCIWQFLAVRLLCWATYYQQLIDGAGRSWGYLTLQLIPGIWRCFVHFARDSGRGRWWISTRLYIISWDGKLD